MTYFFHSYNAIAPLAASISLHHLLGKLKSFPVIVCIGSDLVIGDSLGPLVGSMLSEKEHIANYVYGTLRSPVTAKEINYLHSFIQNTHPNSKIIAIDASFGDKNEIGLIKFSNKPIAPGAGVNKCLQNIGDVGILGIVAEKNTFPVYSLDNIRLSLVYRMAELITTTISSLFSNEQ